MNKTIDLKKHEAELASFLNGIGDNVMVTSEQAAKIMGLSLRTIRNWEKSGKMPPREPVGCYPRRYKLVDIKFIAKRYKQILGLQALSFEDEQIEMLFKMSVQIQRNTFVQFGFHPSLWP